MQFRFWEEEKDRVIKKDFVLKEGRSSFNIKKWEDIGLYREGGRFF